MEFCTSLEKCVFLQKKQCRSFAEVPPPPVLEDCCGEVQRVADALAEERELRQPDEERAPTLTNARRLTHASGTVARDQDRAAQSSAPGQARDRGEVRVDVEPRAEHQDQASAAGSPTRREQRNRRAPSRYSPTDYQSDGGSSVSSVGSTASRSRRQVPVRRRLQVLGEPENVSMIREEDEGRNEDTGTHDNVVVEDVLEGGGGDAGGDGDGSDAHPIGRHSSPEPPRNEHPAVAAARRKRQVRRERIQKVPAPLLFSWNFSGRLSLSWALPVCKVAGAVLREASRRAGKSLPPPALYCPRFRLGGTVDASDRCSLAVRSMFSSRFTG